MENGSNKLLYSSNPSKKNLWQKYKIYASGLELQCRVLFYTFKIDIKDILSVEVCEPGWYLRKWWVMNFDWSPFNRNVLIEVKHRFWRSYVRFTSDNPDKFAQILKNLV